LISALGLLFAMREFIFWYLLLMEKDLRIFRMGLFGNFPHAHAVSLACPFGVLAKRNSKLRPETTEDAAPGGAYGFVRRGNYKYVAPPELPRRPS
jgi:hypothetical protein